MLTAFQLTELHALLAKESRRRQQAGDPRPFSDMVDEILRDACCPGIDQGLILMQRLVEAPLRRSLKMR